MLVTPETKFHRGLRSHFASQHGSTTFLTHVFRVFPPITINSSKHVSENKTCDYYTKINSTRQHGKSHTLCAGDWATSQPRQTPNSPRTNVPPPNGGTAPSVPQGLLIIEASRSHSVGLHWTSDQPDAETSSWQHSQDTDTHAHGGIRTHNASKRTAADPRLTPRGRWNRRTNVTI